MKQTHGFVEPDKEKKVCKLVKSLYGLKTSAQIIHAKFDQIMLTNEFKINEIVINVFTLKTLQITSSLFIFMSMTCLLSKGTFLT